jgi:hypothetical protein
MSLNIFQKIKSVVWISVKRRCGSFDTLGKTKILSHADDGHTTKVEKFVSFFLLLLLGDEWERNYLESNQLD